MLILTTLEIHKTLILDIFYDTLGYCMYFVTSL